LKKRFKIDTITVTRTSNFSSLADSLAYKGKIGKVYGPYGQKGSQFLVQILSKAPNLFYRISQIFIDTSVFRYRIADSLGNSILKRLNAGSASFEQMAVTYSMGGEGATRGDLGWIARGIMLPQIEHEVSVRKKGETFKVWSPSGLHIIRKTEDPRQDIGFALILRVFL
jgi:PPIC-type PPIASE domain